MASPSKRKGDRAELEVQGILRDLLGVPARRALGAGRKDDVGDIHGVPDTVIQVVNWKDVAKAVREKPLECERQRMQTLTAGLTHDSYGNELPSYHPARNPLAVTHAATFVRLRGGDYRVVMTPEQWAAMWREAQ